MASAKADRWWAKLGYRNEPGSTDISQGRTGEALLRSDTAEIEIATTGEVPEVYSPTPSTFTGHHPGPRTVAAEYYPVSQILRITFPNSSPASGGSYNYYSVSADEWDDFRSSASPGRWIEAVGRYKSYGQAAAPTPQAAAEPEEA